MLKSNILLLIETHEHLSLLSEVVDGLVEDALYIDEPYFAFMDEVLWVIPQSELEEGHFMSGVKPRRFMPWYRSVKRKEKNEK